MINLMDELEEKHDLQKIVRVQMMEEFGYLNFEPNEEQTIKMNKARINNIALNFVDVDDASNSSKFSDNFRKLDRKSGGNI